MQVTTCTSDLSCFPACQEAQGETHAHKKQDAERGPEATLRREPRRRQVFVKVFYHNI